MPEIPGPQGPPSVDAWSDGLRTSIEGMQAAARWLLGVLAASWFFVPQLTMLRRYVPADPPPWVIAVAIVGVLVSAVASVFVVFRTQTGAGSTIRIRHLSEEDLRYVQEEWDLMRGVPTSDRWRALLAEHEWIAMDARYLPHHPRPRVVFPWQEPIRPAPSLAAGLFSADRLARMLSDERDAVFALSFREMCHRFNLAKVVVLVGAVVAAICILVLVGPPDPRAAAL